ncbi:GntR family transcriptional regulator [Streptomyces sp. NBC_00005]|uniref:GntR family transcriptional regulator n=1 Tax=Streptomyces sp. NBC_00005 TaxID=2903609 RepID=UPI0032503FCD
MLQEEGLIDADINHRGRVTALDAADLDCLYAARISLECVGVRLTAGRLSRLEVQAASGQLHDMDRAEQGEDYAAWYEAHRAFHQILVARCTPTVRRTIASYAERSERYLRVVQGQHRDQSAQRRQEHYDLFAAVVAGEPQRAVRLTAGHLARTAHHVIEHLAPGRGTRDVQEATDMICGSGSEKVPWMPGRCTAEGVHT